MAETFREVDVCSADVFVIVVGDLEREEIRKVEGLAVGAKHVEFVLCRIVSSQNTSFERRKGWIEEIAKGVASNTVPVDLINIR